MLIENAGKVKSVFMISKNRGYLIDDNGKIFKINNREQTYHHILTVHIDLKGYTKLVAHGDNIFIYNEKSQKINAISLSKKIHKWYYYNQSEILKVIDIAIYKGQVYLLMHNKKNNYVYLNLLDIEKQEYENLLRFPRLDKRLYITICKGKAYIYDDKFIVNNIYNLNQGQEESIKDSFCLLVDYNNFENQYFISNDLSVIIFNRLKNTLEIIENIVPYRIGVNTILT